MKYHNKTMTNCAYLTVAAFLIIFSACQKESIQKQTNTLTQNSDNELSLSREGGNQTLTLRPGPDNGQDVYVVKQHGVQSGNTNNVPELSIAEWTVGGAAYHTSSYIRFNSLSKIPPGSTVVSAQLYLYTPPPS